jgi:hypothetical protein
VALIENSIMIAAKLWINPNLMNGKCYFWEFFVVFIIQ